MVTASGGAWNASIVAEYFHFKGQIYTTTGLGATISQATDGGNFDLLLAATMMMAATVVTINRLVWRKLYALAETRTGWRPRSVSRRAISSAVIVVAWSAGCRPARRLSSAASRC